MNILIEILFLLVFLIGFGFGLFLPFLIKKYFNIFNEYQKNIDTLTKKLEEKELQTVEPNSILQDNKIIDEWLNGGDNSEE